ncbi:MAG: hypothetical protein ACI39Q_07415 [Wujia sp.]
MSDKMSEVYEAYDMEIHQTMRGRGAILLSTDKGVFQLKTPDVNESRLIAEYQFKEKLNDMGFVHIDRCIRNNRDELVTFDRYNNPYVMRYFFSGRECNMMDAEERAFAVDNLARLHEVCRMVWNSTEGDVHIRMCSDFRKRNQEMKRVRNFIIRQKQKREFEELYLRAYDYFFEQAKRCEELYMARLQEMNGDDGDGTECTGHLGYCHGMYNQHSVLLCQDDMGAPFVATINFDRFYVGNQLNDLYHFLRKAVEKNNYNIDVAQQIIRCYAEKCPLNSRDIEYIYILYSYPEKFYKISNQYINAPKNWISPKMLEKLYKVIQDEDNKKNVLDKINDIRV